MKPKLIQGVSAFKESDWLGKDSEGGLQWELGIRNSTALKGHNLYPPQFIIRQSSINPAKK